MKQILKRFFGFEDFRPLQEEIIRHVLGGEDAFVIMPTGGGKSLCFQLPALMLDGVTLVVSPLIALMKDQVDALQANGIAAAMINSSLSQDEIQTILDETERGAIKLLYLAPERLALPSFSERLKRLPVRMVAIDEAHCISEWGHDFRPDYRNLAILRQALPSVPWIALTATANEQVRSDVIKTLKLDKGRVFLSSFNRPNLSYFVRPKKQMFEHMVNALKATKGSSAIVYCLSRKGTEELAERLRGRGMEALPYHAGLNDTIRRETQEKFIRDRCPIIVATIAFGMGIDKSNVRLVVHADLPRSVEGYYQETGRAGRDGLPSKCLFFFSKGDRWKREYFIREIQDRNEQMRARAQLDEMMHYAETPTCRRKFLLEYFGEAWPQENCNGCDRCLKEQTVEDPAEVLATYEEPEEYNGSLFNRLRSLRRRLAEERDLPPYLIFSDKSLMEMASLFPQSLASMSKIHGVGEQKLATFAQAFVDSICTYAVEAGGLEDHAQVPRLTATLEYTKDLIEKRYSIEQVAQTRGLVPETIVSHLEQILRQQKIPIDHLRPEPARLEVVQKAFKDLRTRNIGPIKERLGAGYSYADIRLARLFV